MIDSLKNLGLKIEKRLNLPAGKAGIKDLGLKISGFLILISLILLLAPSAQAQESLDQYLRVSPIISEVTIEPNKETTFDLEVENLSSKPMGISLQTSNLIGDDPTEVIDDAPLMKWTDLSENNFIIDPNSQRSVQVRIKPPSDLKKGGYYEVIYLTPFIGGQNQAQKPVVLSRIGVLVFATFGDLDYKNLKEKVIITRFGPSSFLQDKSEVLIDLEVDNKYFTHFSAKPEITISSLFGSVDKQTPEEKRILPGRTRSWEIPEEVKNYGIYRVRLALSVGGGR